MRRRRMAWEVGVGWGFDLEYNRRACCDEEEKDGEGKNQSLPELLEANTSEFRDIFKTNLCRSCWKLILLNSGACSTSPP